MSWKTLLAAISGELNVELARQIDFLKAENKILRSQIKGRIRLKDSERRTLAELGKPLGRRILEEISTIVTPDTLLRWHRKLIAMKFDGSKAKKRLGRPPTREEIRELVLQFARESPSWGYTRIQGALKNVGHRISRSTVANILKEAGLEPAPEREKGTSWKDFIDAHKDVLCATDFFTQEVWESFGLVTYYVLFFIHIGTRRLHVAGLTEYPDSDFMEQIARELTFEGDGFLRGSRYLIHDRDGKYSPAFDKIIADTGIKVIKLPARSPNLNAFAERWVQSVRRECLDKLILFGERSLRYALREYLHHYHGERNHQGKGNAILFPSRDRNDRLDGPIRCRKSLGGLLRYYYREAG